MGGIKYTPDEDRIILDAVQTAEKNGITLDVLFMKLADDLGRSSAATVSRRYYTLAKSKTEAENAGTGASDVLDVVRRVKDALRERDAYRAKYEAEKQMREKMEHENGFKAKYEAEKRRREQLEKQMKQLKKLLG